MDKSRILSACILAGAIVVCAALLAGAADKFTNKDRRVTVKGLSEIEVPADRVTWSIMTVETGNDVQGVYDRTQAARNKIVSFLKSGGVKEDEIFYNSPGVVDMRANRWDASQVPYNYKISSVITVFSENVEQVRTLIARQGELLEQGIVILNDGYTQQVSYDLSSFSEIKPRMMEEAILNARKTADQFAENSHSRLGKIISADQGQFSMYSKDSNTPYIIKLRVVTTITYSLIK